MNSTVTSQVFFLINPNGERGLSAYKNFTQLVINISILVGLILLMAVVYINTAIPLSTSQNTTLVIINLATVGVVKFFGDRWYTEEELEPLKLWQKQRRQLISSPQFRPLYNMVVEEAQDSKILATNNFSKFQEEFNMCLHAEHMKKTRGHARFAGGLVSPLR